LIKTKKRLLTKETLAKNLMVSSLILQSTLITKFNENFLDSMFQDFIKVNRTGLKNKEIMLNRWIDLYDEYNKDRKSFVIKYFRKNKLRIIGLGKKYPITYGKLYELLENFEKENK